MAEATINLETGKVRWPRRLACRAAWVLGSLITLLIVLYLVALVDQYYHARRAMRLYNQLLTVRLGDTVAELHRKVPDCRIAVADGEYACAVQPMMQRIPLEWYLMSAHQDAYIWESERRQKIGLRDWHLRSSLVVRQGRVSELQTGLLVTGQDMMLGGLWGLAPEIPAVLLRVGPDADSTTPANINTFVGVTHITSTWGGQGYHMELTPGSSAQDLRMREINARCLTSFAGCRDSRELLPNVPPAGHPRYW